VADRTSIIRVAIALIACVALAGLATAASAKTTLTRPTLSVQAVRNNCGSNKPAAYATRYLRVTFTAGNLTRGDNYVLEGNYPNQGADGLLFDFKASKSTATFSAAQVSHPIASEPIPLSAFTVHWTLSGAGPKPVESQVVSSPVPACV
jgi:hypothetical protein